MGPTNDNVSTVTYRNSEGLFLCIKFSKPIKEEWHNKKRADTNKYHLALNKTHNKNFLSWALTDSNRRPSACKADALNQLS